MCIRDRVEVVQLHVVHLSLLVGELTRADTGSFVDHNRWLDLLKARCGGSVEEEVDQGTL